MKQKSDLEPSTLSWLAYYSSQSLYRTMALQSTKTPYDFLPARRYASAGYSDRNVSVCLCVRHAPVLCQNEES